MTSKDADGWSIVETEFRSEHAKAWEGLFTLGSGYLHVRGSLEEHLSDAPQNVTYTRLPANVTAESFRETKSKWGTYVPGIFGKHPLLNNEMINLPWFLGMAPIIDDERVDMESRSTSDYRRELRLDDATLVRTFTWRTKSGNRVALTFERFVSAARPHLCVQRLIVKAEQHAGLQVVSGIDADVRTNGYDHFQSIRFGPAPDCARAGVGTETVSCEVDTDAGDRISIVSELRYPFGTRRRYNTSERSCELTSSVDAQIQQQVIFEKRIALSTSRDSCHVQPAEVLDQVRDLTYAQLHNEHAEIWRKRWESCDVVIEGDAASQLAMRVSLFHLLRAHVTDDSRVAIDAKGYAGEAYWGRYFWDTEMFLLPFFLYTDPRRARTLADFRVQSLDGARENAKRYGYPGARYAWESDARGVECCPNWQYGDHEVHVTADVAYGLAHYAKASGDGEYLEGAAAEVLLETARYWMARIDQRPGERRASLLGVMGPDEYTPISNNNSFTNIMVAGALRCAGQVSGSAGASPDECRRFRRVADRLFTVKRKDGLILQCEEFERLAEPRFDELWLDRTRPFASQVSQERLYRSKALKQADVLMLMMLFPQQYKDEEVRRAWDYYVPYTTHDSSLSAGVHAIVANRLGLRDEAWQFWLRSRDIDLDVAHGGAAEGIHIANAGAVWQVAVLGFAGMRTAMQSKEFHLNPRLPDAWSRLAFPVMWKGTPLVVDITRDTARIENRGPAPIAVRFWDERVHVAPGTSASWSMQSIHGVIFDLDGVLVSTDELHYVAWKEIADAEGIYFDHEINHRLRGVSRMASLDIVLERASRTYSVEEKQQLADRKNAIYRASLQSLLAGDALPGVVSLLDGLKARGVRLAVASSSRNARTILERIGLSSLFDAIVDGSEITHSKPHPEVFLLAAARLGLRPEACLVVEDAQAGIEAARAARMAVFGVGDPHTLPGLEAIATDLSKLSAQDLLARASRGS